MRSSQHFRAQARLYADIARTLSDRKAADTAMATAAECLAKAEEMELRERESESRIKSLH
jgi:hypothetical protein